MKEERQKNRKIEEKERGKSNSLGCSTRSFHFSSEDLVFSHFSSSSLCCPSGSKYTMKIFKCILLIVKLLLPFKKDVLS
jgi:hypothetical protein